jgi:hypothetical protein
MAACAGGCGRDVTGIAVANGAAWHQADTAEQTVGLGWHPSCAMAAHPDQAGLIRSFVTTAPS